MSKNAEGYIHHHKIENKGEGCVRYHKIENSYVEEPPEPGVCRICGQTGRKCTLQKHLTIMKRGMPLLNNDNVFKIQVDDNGEYEVVYRNTGNQTEKMKFFKCKMCTYESVYRAYLLRHLLKHKKERRRTLVKIASKLI